MRSWYLTMSTGVHSKKKRFFYQTWKDLPLDRAPELLIVLYNKSFVTNLPYKNGFLTKGFVWNGFRTRGFVKTSSIHISNFTVLHCLLNELSFFRSRSTWQFKSQLASIILAQSSGISLMDLFGDEKTKWELLDACTLRLI